MGTSICSNGAALANTPCSSSGMKTRDASKRTGGEIYSSDVDTEHKTKHPQAASGSSRAPAPSNPSLLPETGGCTGAPGASVPP